MPPVHIKLGGVWKEVDAVHIKTGGSWRAVAQAHIKTGGSWRESLGSSVVIDVLVGELVVSKITVAWGYDRLNGPTGTVDPTTYEGHTIDVLRDVNATNEYQLRLATHSLGAGFISKITVEDSGSTITLTASDATYSTDSSTHSIWKWSSTFWTGDWSNDDGFHRDVEIFS